MVQARGTTIGSRLEVPQKGLIYTVLARGAVPGYRYCNQSETALLGLKRHNRFEAPPVDMCTIPDAIPPCQRHIYRTRGAFTKAKVLAPGKRHLYYVRSAKPDQQRSYMARGFTIRRTCPICTRPENPYQAKGTIL